jgi:hypothetical protein
MGRSPVASCGNLGGNNLQKETEQKIKPPTVTIHIRSLIKVHC